MTTTSAISIRTPVTIEDKSYLDGIADRWWSFSKDTDEENFKMFLRTEFGIPVVTGDFEADVLTRLNTKKMPLLLMDILNPDKPSEERQKWERFKELRKTLLGVDGIAACFAHPEPDMENILARGQFWSGEGARWRRGSVNRCHQNVSALWTSGSGFRICTGYALSGKIWRQHSWAIKTETTKRHGTRDVIIETTAMRDMYFGFVMSDSEADSFAKANV